MKAYNYFEIDNESTTLIIEDEDTIYEFNEFDRNMLENCEDWTDSDCKNYLRNNEPISVRSKDYPV